MSRSTGLRWVWVVILLLGLSSLACITTEIGIKVIHTKNEEGKLTARVAMHLTNTYVEAARRANADRAKDYQQAGLDIPEKLFPETFQELEGTGLSAEELVGEGETQILEQSDRGFTIEGTKAYNEKDGLGADTTGGWSLAVNRDDPEWVHYVLTIEITEMSSEIDLAELERLRSEGVGPKPPIETAEEPAEPDADDIGSFIVMQLVEGIFGALPETGMELDGWYAERVLLESGLPTMTYWGELPGKVVSHQLNGQPAGTIDAATNRVTLVIDEAYLRRHPEGAGGVWRVESVVHTCEEQCSSESHQIWDGASGPEECLCTCEPGWKWNETGDACVEGEAAKKLPTRFIGNPANLEALLRSRGYSEVHCLAYSAYPPGAVFLWSRGAGVAHSSVMTMGDRQIEMGHKSGGKKYVSERLLSGQNPDPFNGTYVVSKVLCPPLGTGFDSDGAVTMAGLDRNYGAGQPDEWNCHGFSANVISRYAHTGIDIRPGSRYRWEGNRLILEQGEVHIQNNDRVQVEVINGKVYHHSEFVVVARADGTAQIAVLAGEVTFEGTEQAITLRTGELTDLDASGAPSAATSFARRDLVAWWESDELIRLPAPEPPLADFRALELSEVKASPLSTSTEVEKSSAPALVISERRRMVAALSVGGAVMLVGGSLLLVFGGAIAWQIVKRREIRSSPPSPALHSALDSMPEEASRFDWAEQRFAKLQANYRSGRLDLATFRAEVQKLVVEDQHGQYWALGGEGGAWYWYDGQAWVRQEPPR